MLRHGLGAEHVSPEEEAAIEARVRTGHPLGDEAFVEALETASGRQLKAPQTGAEAAELFPIFHRYSALLPQAWLHPIEIMFASQHFAPSPQRSTRPLESQPAGAGSKKQAGGKRPNCGRVE